MASVLTDVVFYVLDLIRNIFSKKESTGEVVEGSVGWQWESRV